MTGTVALARPPGAVVLRRLTGDVPGCASEPVYAALVERLDPRGESGFATDPATMRLVVQGGYWYRAEYAVETTAEGSRLHLTIVNVAPGWKLLGALTGRAVVRAAPAEFAHLLATLEAVVHRTR